jgi:hypothetical protein
VRPLRTDSILPQKLSGSRRLPHISVAKRAYTEFAEADVESESGTHDGRMTLPEAFQSQSNLPDYLATLARVRATCEQLSTTIPMPAENYEWQGVAERAFADNSVALRRRASAALVWIDAAEEAARRRDIELGCGPRSG